MDPALVVTVALVSLAVGALGARLVRGRRPPPRPLPRAEVPDPARLALEQLPIGVLLFADNGVIRLANARAAELLFNGEAMTGHNFLRLLADAPARVREPLSAGTDLVFSLEHAGEQETFQLLRRELTLEARAHTLLLLNPLTRELARRELELLKKVIRVITHELNNSLSSMSSFTGSARFIAEHPEQLHRLPRVLDGIDERTRHLRDFLGEYATLARLPSPRPREVEWAPLLDRLARMFPALIVDEPPAAPGWFDEAQVEQALINLIKNASEAAPGAEVRLLLRARESSLELGALDRGPGFSEEALEFGLLPFFTTKPGGSGLGLALCREIAEGHGGSLRIREREGGGAAVYLVLPRREREASAPPAALTLTAT
ncbi:MAG: HAMP domain-containing histidine kinase [Myxococcales bacterium]|nr:HAMP domain-containing histidine kinase [Myxococcales bacterium]MCB9751062.1 HAMP domain-containing histidine kinase [Myxococcales bacterium]